MREGLAGWILGLVSGAIIVGSIMLAGERQLKKRHRQEAVDAGHAEWVVDQKTGQKLWRWKVKRKETTDE